MAVNAYSERWLRRGFPWVYAKEVVGPRAPAGAAVELRGPQGGRLGWGYADDGWIAARVYRHGEGTLDDALLRTRLDHALQLREALIGPDTTGYRLVHAENDGLPGLRVDWWDHYAVLILDSPGVGPLVPGVLEWLVERRQPRGVVLCYRADPRDERTLEDPSPAPGLVAGKAPRGAVRVRERGLFFDVHPLEAPDVGLYTDMRDVRAWLEPHWSGTRVLNTFAYTGAFSVAAAAHGATEVVSVDLSGRYLDRAEANFAANDLDPGPHELVEADTFKALDRFRRTGRRFDRVVLDPPSFSRGPDGVFSSRKHTPRLVAAACRVTAPGGWVIAASNQGELSPHQFAGLVAEGVRKAGCDAQLLHQGGQAPDFPALQSFPEGRYLKVGVYRIVGQPG